MFLYMKVEILINSLRRSSDIFFTLQNMVVSTMKRFTMIIKQLHDFVFNEKTVTPELTKQIRLWILMLVHTERILSLYNDAFYASDEYTKDYGGLETIEITLSNLNIERNSDMRLFLIELYISLERVKDNIYGQKSRIHQNERFVNEREARAERDFTPDVQQRLDEDTGEVKVDAVSKDSFYNVLLPGTRVREIDPDSIHICIKKSSDWTKENPKYLMMNLKTKEKKELEHENNDLKPGSKVALVVLDEWEVQRHQGEDDYVMQTLGRLNW